MSLNLPGRGGAARCVKELTFTGAAGAHTDDLFLISGPVVLTALWGTVTSTLAAGLTVAFWDLWDGNASTALTLNNGVVSLLPAGSAVWKAALNTATMSIGDATATVLAEPALGVDSFRSCVVVPTAGATATLRFRHTSAGATSGTIRFVCEYQPLARAGLSPA